MSLTSLLAHPDVKARFKEEFELPNITLQGDLRAAPKTKNYPLVGTAFDYLMRFYLKKLNPKAETQAWVAEGAVSRLARQSFDPFPEDPGMGCTPDEKIVNFYNNANNRLANAKKNYQAYLESKNNNFSSQLIQNTLQLAQLDAYFRGSYMHDYLGETDPGDVEDLRQLIGLVDPAKFQAKKLLLLNPTFGDASRLVGGADADLILDDTLIDIKTTKFLELKREHFNQLLGYYALYRISGIPADTQIKNVAIYFSRHGQLITIPLQGIINETRFSAFLEWFEKRAKSNQPITLKEARPTKGKGRKSKKHPTK